MRWIKHDPHLILALRPAREISTLTYPGLARHRDSQTDMSLRHTSGMAPWSHPMSIVCAPLWLAVCVTRPCRWPSTLMRSGQNLLGGTAQGSDASGGKRHATFHPIMTRDSQINSAKSRVRQLKRNEQLFSNLRNSSLRHTARAVMTYQSVHSLRLG
jgi:hypothetical protein